MIGLDNITKTHQQHNRYTLQRLGQLPLARCGVVGVTMTSVKDTVLPLPPGQDTDTVSNWTNPTWLFIPSNLSPIFR